MAPETGFFQTEGGTILELDIPTISHARERFDAKIEKGELIEIDADDVEREDDPDGTWRWKRKATADAQPAKGRRRPPKPEPEAETTTELSDDVPAGSVADVLKWVAAPDDGEARLDRAERALVAEANRGDKARSSLQAKLEEIIGGPGDGD